MQLRKYLRFLAATQLLPALESGEETLVGGQAVLEGVMMRSPHAWAIAVRKPSGEIASHREGLERPSEKHKWMAWPVVRGVVTLGQAMALGFRALRFSANVALNEMQPTGSSQKAGVAQPALSGSEGPSSAGPALLPTPLGSASLEAGATKKIEISGWLLAVNVVISLGFFIFMYKFLPLVAATELKRVAPAFGSQVAFTMVDGVVRIALFLLFIWATSLWSELRRVYQYHGAEHKTVFAFESGGPLTIPNAQRYSTYHPRCGTSFLMTVMLISIAIYMMVPASTFATRFLVRIALLPVIAGVSYEIIRFAARLRNRPTSAEGGQMWGTSNAAGWLFTALTTPGLWLQRITTQPPADDQVECAISALDQAMELEKMRGGELVIA